ncbi:caspase family protein [Tumidithrix elongata RA019]|uniref:Caspase family protein n=1 Tax=Tumidithrix elongata BACA0141 TaxID=2716417 RepID=A0AAW9PWI9_9CYAN|nr:caspase family protein [Tumidithrix elongata RA019]
MGIARRRFLQGGLVSLIGGQLVFGRQAVWAADRYAQKLAQPHKRKLALLIGINQYDAKGDWLPLTGCVTDVELQKELLIHRFGFDSKDILTLTDRQATGQAIAEAVAEHLIGQTLPGDLVVMHFSGHGSRLGKQNTLVPIDSGLPSAGELIHDITEATLTSWQQAIATDQIVTILDTGYNYPGTPVVGNFRIRARPGKRDWQPSAAEIALQQEFSQKFGQKKSDEQLGMILRAANNDELCADALWSGFSSGVFTYALTQQLWQITPATSLHVVLNNVVNTLAQKAFRPEEINLDKQMESHVEGNLPKAEENKPTHKFGKQDFSLLATSLPTPALSPSADGVIRSTTPDRKTGETWLAGLPISSIGYYGVGSVLAVAPDRDPSDMKPSNANHLVQVRSHNGLTAKVEVMDTSLRLESGQLLQEQIRALPRNLGLTIALDLSLSKIERIDATSAISAMPSMLGFNATEQCADCLFGAESTSYGLFTVGRSPILGSFGSVGESVGAAIKRLQPLFEGLLAAKLIRLTANQASSCLGLRATMSAEVGQELQPKILGSKVTDRASESAPKLQDSISSTWQKSLAIGDRLACHLENLTDRPLYVRIFSFDPRGKVLTPSFVTSPYASDGIIQPKETLVVPQPNAPFNWVVSAPQGMVDVQVVVSHSPLSQTSLVLESSMRQASSPTGMMVISDPLKVAQALLLDLHQAGQASLTANSEDLWMLDVSRWATLGFSYHVA